MYKCSEMHKRNLSRFLSVVGILEHARAIWTRARGVSSYLCDQIKNDAPACCDLGAEIQEHCVSAICSRCAVVREKTTMERGRRKLID